MAMAFASRWIGAHQLPLQRNHKASGILIGRTYVQLRDSYGKIHAKDLGRRWRPCLRCRAAADGEEPRGVPKDGNEDLNVKASKEERSLDNGLAASADTRQTSGEDTRTPAPPETTPATSTSNDTPIPVGAVPDLRLGSGPAGRPAMSKQVIDVLRDQVFGFDTFFVTSQRPYEAGALFNGNLRGDPEKAFEKISTRLKEKFGDTYRLYLLNAPDSEKPIAVVVPKESVEPETASVPDWVTALAFGLSTMLAILYRNGFPFDPVDFPEQSDLSAAVQAGLPGTLVTLAILSAHEAGHWWAAKRVGARLSAPFLVPSWQLGTFGAITRITSVLPGRQALVEVAAAGPLAGSAVALLAVVIGLLVPLPGDLTIPVDSSAFHESLLVGGLCKLVLGDALREGATVSLSPLVLAAWSALLVNSLNAIPFGELDGGRIAVALFGRKAAARWTGVSVGLMVLAALFNDVALYFVILAIVLQRQAVTPQANEVASPSSTGVALGVGTLVLAFLVMFPEPLPFS